MHVNLSFMLDAQPASPVHPLQQLGGDGMQARLVGSARLRTARLPQKAKQRQRNEEEEVLYT